MSKSNQTKFYWQRILGIFAIVSSSSMVSSAAIANPYSSSELLLAQVGVRHRPSAPTPLNLRPRNHIPSTTSRHSRYNRHRDRRYSGYNKDYYRDLRSNRRYSCQHRSDYDCNFSGQRHDESHDRRNRKRRTRGSFSIYF